MYVTDHLGRVDHVEGRWEPTTAADVAEHRNKHQQSIAGKPDRLTGDVGGHLIAASGAGAGEGINLIALRDTINGAGGDYGKMEAEIRNIASQQPGAQIELVIDLGYPGSSRRPDQIDIDVLVDGQLAGRVDFAQ
ncbi:DNA/RNA non-specific endonuclease [Cellulomonas xiejunii]|uniref:DNA/RNA non-specific endonuclease n=1 Tax=Cellulomonas xiejunii TaxID=2968083 RepID=UPI001D0EC5AF|nr:DNA/RNA non-specific endonuclease [Cellulomonas xiejunii]MCC2313278.1 DNA/RNA non-specific endonuclease [Cellulomonas xiejunii]